MSDNEKEKKASEQRKKDQEELRRIAEKKRREQRELEERIKNQGIGSGDRPKKK